MIRIVQYFRFRLILLLAGSDVVLVNATINRNGRAIFVPHGRSLLARNVEIGDDA